MERTDWYQHAANFPFARELGKGTRELYSLGARQFLDWAFENQVSPELVTATDVERFRHSLLERGLTRATVDSKTFAIRAFYRYLVSKDLATVDPTSEFPAPRISRVVRDVLSVEDLAALWDASHGQDRVIVGLLGICAVRSGELVDARVEDLHVRDGHLVLTLPERTGAHEFDFVAIPPQLAIEIHDLIGDRRTGQLLRGPHGGRISRRSLVTALKRASTAAAIAARPTTLTLSFALRAIALEQRFSYVSVIRSVSEWDPRRLAEWVRRVDVPVSEHASMRVGRMMFARSVADQMFLRAELLLNDRAQHPAASIVVSAGTLERELRAATEARGVVVTKKDANLSTYATRLRGDGALSIPQLRTIELILGLRNNAAHGWFDGVTREDAMWVLAEARSLVEALAQT